MGIASVTDDDCSADSNGRHSPSRDRDGCSVCRLLAHFGNGHFDVPMAESHQQVTLEVTLLDARLDAAEIDFDHSPRGPPCIL